MGVWGCGQIDRWREIKGRQMRQSLILPKFRAERYELGMTWIRLGPHIMTAEIQLITAVEIVEIAAEKKCGHMIFHFMIAYVKDRNFSPNYHHNLEIPVETCL